MHASTASDTPDITLSLVRALVAGQFPEWAHLPIQPVEVSGWDNRTFRLGEDMSIRLPSAEAYAAQVPKEQKWLPFLAPQVSLQIPEPLAQGRPSTTYPWHWSLYRWIPGASVNTLSLSEDQLQCLALDCAGFLLALQAIDATGGPPPGEHNFYRGASPRVYDVETRAAIDQLREGLDAPLATDVWEKALSSEWERDPVWIHGDFSAGNLLAHQSAVTAIIDFGCMGVGDPACDLTLAWTLLSPESRKIFRAHMGLDAETWARARGWALWKAVISIASLKDRKGAVARQHWKTIEAILIEHEFEN